MRPIALPLLAAALAACGSDANDRLRHLEPSWSIEASGRSRGVAVAADGNLVWSVGFGAGAFADDGGVAIVARDGKVRAEVPLSIAPPCEGCTQLMFQPAGRALVAGDAAWVSDFSWNVFRVDLAAHAGEAVAVTAQLELPGGLVGISDASAITADGARAFLPGNDLIELELDSGTVRRALPFGRPVRAIAPLGDDAYLLDLTEPLSDAGRVAIWNERTGDLQSFDLPNPVAAIGADEGWAVAAVELALGEYGLVEFDATAVRSLATFELPAGALHLALVADERVVVAGSAGIQVPTQDGALLVGSAVVVDADEGPIAALETSSVSDLAISPDRKAVYVCDTGGLKAFSIE